MKYLQKLGRSLMLPVATLPIAAILMGIGYWIDPTGWGANNALAALLIKAGGAIIDNMGILFAIGVAVGMSADGDGTSALAGLVSSLMIQTILSPATLSMITKVDVESIDASFSKINNGNQFFGILCGLIGSICYNRFKDTKLPTALSFFSGRRSVAIMTGLATLLVAVPLYFVWPLLYNALIALGTAIVGLGPIGAGIYAFLNRLLIPFGLHHALNSVFWFDLIGINDLNKFWGAASGGIMGQTGMYMTGFFPFMMFGLPAACFAMYLRAKKDRKEEVGSLFASSSVSSFLVGITEPIEFSFMFQAPVLYGIHAVLSGIIVGIVAALPVRSGFNFSAGFIDWFLSFKAPYALNPWAVIPIGLVVGVIYFVVFYFAIGILNAKTPGREDEDIEAEKKIKLSSDNYGKAAEIILAGLGGKDNISSLENCITRLRVTVKDYTQVNENKIKSAGVAGIIRPDKTSVQVIIGTDVQFVADEVKKML